MHAATVAGVRPVAGLLGHTRLQLRPRVGVYDPQFAAHSYSMVVVDDGSSDDTGAILNGPPLRYLRHPVNLGQGAALQTGMDYAQAQGAEYVVHFDADGQHPGERIPSLLAPFLRGECDLAVGSKFLDPESVKLISRSRRILLRGAVFISGILTNLWLSDAHNGFRALSRAAAQRTRLHENGFASGRYAPLTAYPIPNHTIELPFYLASSYTKPISPLPRISFWWRPQLQRLTGLKPRLYPALTKWGIPINLWDPMRVIAVKA